MAVKNLLQSSELFSNIAPEVLEKISHLIKSTSYKKGDIILDRHHAENTFLYVTSGWIKIFNETANGEEALVDILSKNHHCGEQFIFNINESNVYTAQCISDAGLLSLPIKSLKKLMLLSHQLALNFLKSTLQKQQNLTLEVEHLSIQNAAQRIGCCILRLCAVKKEKSTTIHLPCDKLLLASRLGMRSETFSRGLATLSKQCNIRVNGDTIYIDDIYTISQYVCQHCSLKFPCNATFLL